MANPMEALRSYQQALDSGTPVDPSEMNGDYLMRSGTLNCALDKKTARRYRFNYDKLISEDVSCLNHKVAQVFSAIVAPLGSANRRK